MAGTSYTRQSTIADGNIITAALFNNEFNQLINAFAYASAGTTGHSHDGSAGQGAAISKIGDQDFKNKIEVSATNNRIEFYAEVGGAPVEQVRIQDGAIVPVTDSDVDLGTTSVRFKDAFVNSATVTGAVSAATVTSSGTTNIVTGVVTGGLTLTGADYNIVFDASASELKFNDGADLLIGTNNDLRIYHDGSNTRIREQGTGLLYITADTQTSMGSSNGAASFVVEGANGTTFSAGGTQKMFINSDGVNFPDDAKLNIGNSSDLQIYHDGTDSRITDTGTGNLYLTGASNISLLSAATTYGVFGTSVDLYYNNAKKFETTSSGATVSGSLTATGAVNATAFLATTNIDTPQIEVTSLRARDGSAAGSIADSSGVVTLGSAILTTADINGGSADNVVIGGSTAAAGSFTTLGATGLFSGSDITLTDSNPKITFIDSDGTNQTTEQVQASGSFVTTVRNNTSHGSIDFKSNNGTNSLLRFRVATDGDFNFYENDGSTVGVKWDAPNGRLGIGTTSPATALSVAGKITTTEGIYLGGTAAANLLDDYEEGTWTPAMRDATTGGNVAGTSNIAGVYTKIGNQVTLTVRVINASKTGLTSGNGIYITGLPFAASDLSPAYRHIGTLESTRIAFDDSIQTRITENTSYIELSSSTASGGLATLNWSAVSADESSAGVADLFITQTYIAD